MKARDIKVGDVIDGWKVADVELVTQLDEMTHVLLTLERQQVGVRMRYTTDGLEQTGLPLETRRTWYPADEEVEVSRGA